jgi:hypothetical protein
MIDVLKRTFPFPVVYVHAERSFPWESIPSGLAKKRVLSARPTSLSIELPYAYGVMVQARVAAQLFPPDLLHMGGTIAVVSLRVRYATNWRAFAMNMGILFHNVKQSVWKFVLYSSCCKCYDYDINCSRHQRNTRILWARYSYSRFCVHIAAKESFTRSVRVLRKCFNAVHTSVGTGVTTELLDN